MTFQLLPSQVKHGHLSRAGRSLAYDKTGTGKVARDIVIATTLGGGGAGLVRRFPTLSRKIGIHAYKHGVPAFVNYLAIKPVLPAVRGDRKIGIRFGTDRVMPMGLIGGPLGMYVVPSLRRLPIPIFGFGFTAVPNDEPFFSVRSQSRGGEDATSTGTPRSITATKTIVGPLAPQDADRRPSTITPLAPGRGDGRKTAGGNYKKRRPGARPRSTPYCWRHKRRHYCKMVK